MTHPELVAHFPLLYHVAEADVWGSVRRHGLESTSALLDRFGVTGPEREAAEYARRPRPVVLHHPEFGAAVVRDQRPIVESVLPRCLTHMTAQQWYKLLNGQVFFWPTRERLYRLLGARMNRLRHHCVLTIDTQALLKSQGAAVRLSPINSGCTRPPLPRGRDTFLPVAEYPFAARCRSRRPQDAVAEVTVEGRVNDVEAVTVRVERFRGADVEAVLWERG